MESIKIGENFKLNPLFIPPIIGAIIAFFGIILFSGDIGIVGNIVLIAFLIAIGPYLIYEYMEQQKIKAIEDQLPAFLLDLSESMKVGLTFTEALRQLSRTDYGKLTSEIKTMNNQISWGIPVGEVLARFGKRLEKSPTTRRVVRIIIEALNSGGDISRTMEATAQDITAIKEAEKERRSMTSNQVIVMYAIYYIFIGIIAGLSSTLLPLLALGEQTAALGSAFSFQDPCQECLISPSVLCISCSTYNLVCSMFALPLDQSCTYNALFLLMIIVQGIFSGLVCGQIGEESVRAGLKHSAIMALTGFAIMMILFQTGIIG